MAHAAVPQLSIPVPLKLDVTARLSVCLSACLPLCVVSPVLASAGRPGRRQTRRQQPTQPTPRTQQRTLASRSTTCTAGTARRSCASRTAAPSRLAPFGRGQLQLELQCMYMSCPRLVSVSVPVPGHGWVLRCSAPLARTATREISTAKR
jgi:hypothetical protein